MNHTSLRPFHLAFPVYSIKKSIIWYKKNLGCSIGRQSKQWVDFNFFGHQITAHKINAKLKKEQLNIVDGHDIPTRHFGIVLTMEQWKHLCEKIKNNKLKFIIEPNIRFKGEKGEQATFFIQDPSDNILEFKAFKDDLKIFEH
tara:strand:- start:1581 stop:2009 length:429 start_codon:yes stop_codon:yes gene_type:complete